MQILCFMQCNTGSIEIGADNGKSEAGLALHRIMKVINLVLGVMYHCKS